MEREEKIIEYIFVTAKKIFAILSPIIFFSVIAMILVNRIKNKTNYEKRQAIEGLVIGKRINKNKKNRYEIIIEAQTSPKHISFGDGSRYPYEIDNDSVFRFIKVRDFFIKKTIGDSCLILNKTDTVALNLSTGTIYYKKHLY